MIIIGIGIIVLGLFAVAGHDYRLAHTLRDASNELNDMRASIAAMARASKAAVTLPEY